MPDGFERSPDFHPKLDRSTPMSQFINVERSHLREVDDDSKLGEVMHIDRLPSYHPATQPFHIDEDLLLSERNSLVRDCFELICKGDDYTFETYLEWVPANAKDGSGITLLSYAVSYGNDSIFWLLRSKGAKATLQNWKTAFINMTDDCRSEVLTEIEKDLTPDEIAEARAYELRKTPSLKANEEVDQIEERPSFESELLEDKKMAIRAQRDAMANMP